MTTPTSNKTAPKTVRRLRNKEGTRVMRVVVCAECGKEDQIRFAPRNQTRKLCRACAALLLGIEDPDSLSGVERSVVCTSCGRSDLTRRPPEQDAEFECRDCFRGILSKQANRSQTAERLSKKVIRVRRAEG